MGGNLFDGIIEVRLYALTQTHGKPQEQRNQRAIFIDQPFRLRISPQESGLHVSWLHNRTARGSGFRTKSLFYLCMEKKKKKLRKQKNVFRDYVRIFGKFSE